MLGLFSSIGWPEIVIILGVALLFFGGKKLPELARGLGKGIREFRKELHNVKNDIEEDNDSDESKEKSPYREPDQTEDACGGADGDDGE